MKNTKPQLQFQSAKAVTAGFGFRDAVESNLRQFQAECPRDLRRGQATVVASVMVPEENVYFAVVLAGPFENLEALQAALGQVADGYLSDKLKRIGIE